MKDQDIYIGEPQYYIPMNEEKYVYALCKCPLPISSYALIIPRRKNVLEYAFKCKKCGTSGTVYSGGRQ